MIRDAYQSDLPRLLALEWELFDNSLSEPVLEQELRIGRGFIYGASIKGYALVRETSGLMDLTRLGVDPVYQGRGIGCALLDHVLVEAGMAYVPVVLTVRKDNARALRLYKAHGFVINGHFSAQGAWVMRWDPA